MVDHKTWRFCPCCGLALVESGLIAKDSDGFISFQVGCQSGHSFLLAYDSRRREVSLRAWARKPEAPKGKDTGLDAWGMCWMCARLPDEHGRCPVHG